MRLPRPLRALVAALRGRRGRDGQDRASDGATARPVAPAPAWTEQRGTHSWQPDPPAGLAPGAVPQQPPAGEPPYASGGTSSPPRG